MRNLSISLLCCCAVTLAVGQSNSKKYIRRNSKSVTYVHYGDSNIYARGLLRDGDRIFIGNSDGSLYYYNLENQKSQLIFKQENFTEMRDIEQYEDVIMGIQSGDNGRLLRLSLNGGMKVMALPEWKGVFLDAMDFNGTRGFLMGDPVNSSYSLFHTWDGGENWVRCLGEVKAIQDEAALAASGTNVRVLNDSTYCFITGGGQSRFIKSTDYGKSWKSVVLPYYPGKSTGAYSMCFANDSIGVIVGGDYLSPELGMNSCFYTKDGGASWYNAMETVRGYRACVYYTKGIFYACGRTGIDFSLDNGLTWIPFADGTFFSMTSTEDKLIATMKNGSLAFFDLIEEK